MPRVCIRRTLFGPIDILINNAGQASCAPITKRDDALWDRLLAINLSGTYFGMQAALPTGFRAARASSHRQYRRLTG